MKNRILLALLGTALVFSGCGGKKSTEIVEDTLPTEVEEVFDDVSSGDITEEDPTGYGVYDEYTGAILSSYLIKNDDGSYFGEGNPGHGTVSVDEVWSYGGFEDVHPVGVLDLTEFSTNQAVLDWLQYMSKWCYCYYGQGDNGYNKLSLYLESDELNTLISEGDCQFRFVSRAIGAKPSEWFIECDYVDGAWSVIFDLYSNQEMQFRDETGNLRTCYIIGFEDDAKVALDDESLAKPRLALLTDVKFD